MNVRHPGLTPSRQAAKPQEDEADLVAPARGDGRYDRGRPAAFTLVEVVIGASLMSIILVAAYLCLNSGLASRKLIEARAEVIQNARVALALLTADLRCACPLAKEFDFLGTHRMVGDTPADNLDFASHNYVPRRPREGDFCEVSYFLDKRPGSGQFSLWRRRNPTIAPNPLSGGKREEIARGLRGLRFEYYDGFEWYDTWGDLQGRPRQEQSTALTPANLSGLPEAVRITLWLALDQETAEPISGQRPKAEPPLVFQTVARLNLAGSASSSTQGGSPSDTGGNPNTQGQPAQTQPGQTQPGYPTGGPNR